MAKDSTIKVKEIRLEPIKAPAAIAFIKKHHYSGKVVNNSQLHFGAFHGGRLLGVMSFGPPMDKSKVIGLVEGTGWNEMVELNRMAFSDVLPHNSESRCIGVAMRLLKKHCPHVKWVLSYSDASQCGDGTIYRAAGFLLTQINPNKSLLRLPGGEVIAQISITANMLGSSNTEAARLARKYGVEITGKSSLQPWLDAGAVTIPGYQLRYVCILDKTARLTVPVLPYSAIDEMEAGMYKGEKVTVSERKSTCAGSSVVERPTSSGEVRGSNPTSALS